jgi:hypothetical protein
MGAGKDEGVACTVAETGVAAGDWVGMGAGKKEEGAACTGTKSGAAAADVWAGMGAGKNEGAACTASMAHTSNKGVGQRCSTEQPLRR